MRKRIIKKYGGTWVIQLTPTDIKDFEITEGDKVDIDNLNLIEGRMKNEPNKL